MSEINRLQAEHLGRNGLTSCDIDFLFNHIQQLEQEVKELKAHLEEEKRQHNVSKNQVIDFCYFYKPTSPDFDLAREQLAQHDKEVAIKALKKLRDSMYEKHAGYARKYGIGSLTRSTFSEVIDDRIKQLQEQE